MVLIYHFEQSNQHCGDGVTILSDYQVKLDEAYQGEFYGLAMYSLIAEGRQAQDEREKWLLLTQLEEVTRQVLEPVLRRHGMTTEAKPESLRAGELDAENYVNLPWSELMQRFYDELDADIMEYSALLEMAPSEDHDAIRFLVDHEIVAKAFCEGELFGKREHSVEPVRALIEQSRIQV
ncbi:MAG: hypothetical protein EBT93_07720 [Alphaproteobacteria bacterium]|nr:hypothetical protein [Alphaproteobacteria bacterium]